MQKKNLIVFDIDGTLTDTVKSYTANFITSIQQLGITEFDPDFGNYKNHTDSYIAKTIYEKAIGKPFDSKVIQKFEDHLFNNMLSEKKCIEIKGAKNIVNFLENDTDYGVCYATGSVRKTAKLKLDQIGIDYHDYQLVASNEILEREKIVSTAIEHAKTFYNTDDFENIISIGDGLWDLKTAKNLEIHFIGIGEKNSDLLLENGAKVVLTDFTFFDLELISMSLFPSFNN